MAYEQKPNTGSLFINEKKTKDNQPDRDGTANIDGKTYRIAAWVKVTSKGTEMLSLKFSEPQAKEEAPY